MRTKLASLLLSLLFLTVAVPAVTAQSEVPMGTRFIVELQNRLDTDYVQRGQRFEARTIDPLPMLDGGYIPAGARLRGRVASVSDRRMLLRFERIDTEYGRAPILATVISVPSERHVRTYTNEEGEIRATGGRGKSSGIGALIGGGLGAIIGGAAGGGRGAAIGAGAGAGTGAFIGAASGGRDLVLQQGARLEVVLDRPLIFDRYR